MKDLIIVGGGPAGLTAAVYALRKRLDVLVVSEDLGGKTRLHWKIPGEGEHRVIRGTEVVERFLRELKYLEFAHRQEKVERIEAAAPSEVLGTASAATGFSVRLHGGESLAARAVIVASGCSLPSLAIAGAGRFLGKGVGYSSTSYAHMVIDRGVLVTGNGWRALMAALELSLSAARVHLAGDVAPFLGSEIGQKLRANSRVTLHPGAAVVEVRGQDAVQEAVLRGPAGDETVAVEAVFVEEELAPNSAFCAGLVSLDERGFILVDLKGRTTRPGVFAAGDVTVTHVEQVLVAVGEGAKAALGAYEFLLTGK